MPASLPAPGQGGSVPRMGSRRQMLGDVSMGAGAGVVSGTLGVGGGIVLTPLLVLVARFEQKQAQATSLVMVTMAAASGAVAYAASGAVAWIPAAFVLIGALAGALIGSSVVQRTSNTALQLGFAFVLVIAAVRLVWPTQQSGGFDVPPLTVQLALAYVVAGLGMGVLSALFGIGGGILLVPVLATLLGFGTYVAAGTSLAVMGPTALLGAIRLTRPGYTQWRRGVVLGAGGVVGALVGAALALSLPVVALRWLFAGVLVFTAARMAWLAVRSRDGAGRR